MQRVKDDEIISSIIHSFKHYGLGDIRHNKKRTISAFILSICFIDQLASFRYPTSENNVSDRVEFFLKQYISKFSGIGLYAIFRNAIIHHYSGKRKFALTNDKEFESPYKKINGTIIINTNILIKEITKGFKEFEADLQNLESEARKNAISRAKKHPPLMHKII